MCPIFLKNFIIRLNDFRANYMRSPVDTGRKLNVPRKFRRLPERLLNVLCKFNLRPLSTVSSLYKVVFKTELLSC